MDVQKEIELFEEILLANPDLDKSLLLKDEDGNYEDSSIADQLGFFQAGIEVAEREARMGAKASVEVESNSDRNAFELACAKSDFMHSLLCLSGEYTHPETQSCWKVWQAKASVAEGFVLVEKKNTEDWYLDESEGMWFDQDGIDGGLCELDIGEVQAVEHKEYLITESNTLYATKVWSDQRQSIDTWDFFKTEEEANK